MRGDVQGLIRCLLAVRAKPVKPKCACRAVCHNICGEGPMAFRTPTGERGGVYGDRRHRQRSWRRFAAAGGHGDDCGDRGKKTT